MNNPFGTGGFDTAKKCFGENIQYFASSSANPEKFNLYKGLQQMAIAMEEMQTELILLRKEIAELKIDR
jgi:hypothetical protein